MFDFLVWVLLKPRAWDKVLGPGSLFGRWSQEAGVRGQGEWERRAEGKAKTRCIVEGTAAFNGDVCSGTSEDCGERLLKTIHLKDWRQEHPSSSFLPSNEARLWGSHIFTAWPAPTGEKVLGQNVPKRRCWWYMMRLNPQERVHHSCGFNQRWTDTGTWSVCCIRILSLHQRYDLPCGHSPKVNCPMN